MSSLTNEQIREILAAAPEGATHVNDDCYYEYGMIVDTYRLSDLAEILALRERVERLEQGNELVIREVWHIVEPDTKEQTQ